MVDNVCGAIIVLTVALAIAGALTIINTLYERRPEGHRRPIKGYVQVGKIASYNFV